MGKCSELMAKCSELRLRTFDHEVRRGLVDIVMQIFQPGSEGKTAHQMVEEGLDKLADSVGAGKKTAMRSKVKKEMDVLIRHHLKGYLELTDNGTYAPTDKFKEHPKTLERISSSLREWANTTQIDSFKQDNEDVEGVGQGGNDIRAPDGADD